jgi:hypothetical protein
MARHHEWEHHQFIKRRECEHLRPIGIEPRWARAHTNVLANWVITHFSIVNYYMSFFIKQEGSPTFINN